DGEDDCWVFEVDVIGYGCFVVRVSIVVIGPGIVEVDVPSAFVVVQCTGLKELPFSMTSHRA
nr:hypothetical protein [Tanacetum cinerariifolium]